MLVDLDQQGNSADLLGIKVHKQQPTLYNLLVEDLAYDQVAILQERVRNEHCVFSYRWLSSVSLPLKPL